MKKIIAISGSFRINSYNAATLKYIIEKYKENINIKHLDISTIPMFCEDLEYNIPSEVKKAIEEISECEGIIISTPEYNQTIPPVLKNLLDWLSRQDGLLNEKSVAIISASPSFIGGARAQVELKKLCFVLGMKIFNKKQLYISNASNKFDDKNNLIDKETKDSIKKFIDEYLKSI
ncbi:MAG: NAD(P)H-dependent oxidoreductase [Bacilli bacterium]|nr:NAD(P)H-dependent oxidoreductase [Bacilli bacterium]